MFGVILILVGAMLDEISASVGKWEVTHKRESIFTFAFLNLFWAWIILVVFTLINGGFVFVLASLPTFIIQVLLEMAQTYSTLQAMVRVERSSLGFLMIGTIPLLLVVDSFMGYSISFLALLGICSIAIGLIVLLINHGIKKAGIGYAIFSTINAVATISLYKYHITHFNSVQGQQIMMIGALLVFYLCLAVFKAQENPFKYLLHKEFFGHSITRGLSTLVISYAYLFASPAVITSAKRGGVVFCGIISGAKYFHEKHIALKAFSFIFVLVGLILLAF